MPNDASKPDGIIEDITGDMPQPQPHAIEAEQADADQRAEQTRDLTDADGNPFDPDVHQADADGNPKLTVKGWIKRKPGRGSAKAKGRAQPGAKSSLHTPGSRAGADEGAAARAVPGQGAHDPQLAGRMIADQIFAMGQLVGGSEWRPLEELDPKAAQQYGISEREQMRQAWAQYCETKGIGDIPPGILVAITMTSYIGTRINMPQTQSRLAKAKEWVYTKAAKFKSRKGRKKAANQQSEKDAA